MRSLLYLFVLMLTLFSVASAGILGFEWGRGPTFTNEYGRQVMGEDPNTEIPYSRLYLGAGAGAVFEYITSEGDSLATNGTVAYEFPGGIWAEVQAVLVGASHPFTATQYHVGLLLFRPTGWDFAAGGTLLHDGVSEYGAFAFVKKQNVILPWLEARLQATYDKGGGVGVAFDFLAVAYE